MSIRLKMPDEQHTCHCSTEKVRTASRLRKKHTNEESTVITISMHCAPIESVGIAHAFCS